MATLIKGGTVVTAEHEARADVLVDGETIAQVGKDLAAPAGARVIDASGAYVLPGGIDPHTHMNLPFMGTTTSEDFLTGTGAAAAGGTTCIIDFAIPSPKQSLLEAYRQWRKWAEIATADYTFHVAVTWWDKSVSDEMGVLCKDHGVNSFKHFMAYKGSMMADDEVLVNSFSRAAELGALCTVHAENGELVVQLGKRLFEQGITGPEGHPLSRPPSCEGEAANRALKLADALGVPLYIVHNSCAEAVEAILRARQNGQRAFGEVLAQHLVIDDSVYRDTDWNKAVHYVMSPPFRAKPHQDALWRAIAAGVLQTTATDHCAFCTAQKQMGVEDFRKIPNGTGGVEDRMSVLWHHGVRQGRLTPSEFVALTSANAAKIFNMYPRKGTIQAGADADVVVWDPEKTRTISVKTNHSHPKMDFNIFEGMTVTGNAAITMSRGKILWENGKLTPHQGWGRYVDRPCFAPMWAAQARHNEVVKPTKVERARPAPAK